MHDINERISVENLVLGSRVVAEVVERVESLGKVGVMNSLIAKAECDFFRRQLFHAFQVYLMYDIHL
jgi:hypothetical protein